MALLAHLLTMLLPFLLAPSLVLFMDLNMSIASHFCGIDHDGGSIVTGIKNGGNIIGYKDQLCKDQLCKDQ